MRLSLLTLCLASTIGLAPAMAQPPQTASQITTWRGTLDAHGTKLRLELNITEQADELTGEMRSLDQGNAKLVVSQIQSDDRTFSFAIKKIGAKFSGQVMQNGTVAQGTFSQSGLNLPLTLTRSSNQAAAAEEESPQTLREAWVGKLKMGIMEPIMQFRIVTTEAGETAAYFDSVTEGRTGFVATWSSDGDQLNFDVASIKLTYRGTLNADGDSAEGTWSQGGRNVPLTLKKQATVYDTANVWENRPQRPVPPFPYDEEEVTIENQQDDLTLAGTLTIPRQPGRHPAVILISGSGPSDRDESIMEHKPFLVLADYLTRRGIAVLRYDDRGTAGSTGKFSHATTADFARDASAAVEFLKQHERINPTEIGLAGHSEGGLIAPMVVGLRDDVAFVVLLAATGVEGFRITHSQTEAMLRAVGTDEAEIAIGMAVQRAVIDVARKASPHADFSEELDEAVEKVIQTVAESDREEAGKNIRLAIRNEKRRLQDAWMRFFLSYDPRPALRSIKCPVLAIWGSKDLQVLPDLNLPEIEKALAASGNPDYEVVELENLNHLFQACETGAMGEYATIQETFNPVALKTIGDWIVSHTTRN